MKALGLGLAQGGQLRSGKNQGAGSSPSSPPQTGWGALGQPDSTGGLSLPPAQGQGW